MNVCGQKRALALNEEINNACEDEIDPKLLELSTRMKLPESYLMRDVNVGFSGEKSKDQKYSK